MIYKYSPNFPLSVKKLLLEYEIIVIESRDTIKPTCDILDNYIFELNDDYTHNRLKLELEYNIELNNG